MSEKPTVLWKPHRGAQLSFHESNADELLYGGAKGGGKSDSILYEATRYMHVNGYRALITRRTYPELEELVDRSHAAFPKLGFSWNAGKARWESSQGGFIRFRSFDKKDSVKKIDGHEYQYIGIDQVEQYPESMYHAMRSCMRSSIKELRPRLRATANPGGVSHSFLKQYFIDVCPPVVTGEIRKLEKYDIEYPVVAANAPVEVDQGLTRQFIPAFVWDNPAILENDPSYVFTLLAQPPLRKRALLFGEWDAFEGQFFGEYNRAIHTVQPFAVSGGWRHCISVDYGYTSPFVVMWHARDYDGNIYTYREYADSRVPLIEHARRVAQLHGEAAPCTVILPHDMREKADRESEWTDATRADIFMKRLNAGRSYENRFTMKFADEGGLNKRISGWSFMRDLLTYNRQRPPQWRIFPGCKQLHKTIAAAIPDETRIEDLHKDADDHWLDATRIGLMHLRPPARIKKTAREQWEDWGDPVIEPKTEPSGRNSWMYN